MKQSKNFPSRITFDNRKEGLIRSALGDLILNKNGFRGPYFKKEKSMNIYRILALGGSTKAGKPSNELTWPRTLERTLNNKLNKNIHSQIINGGVF